MGDGNIVLDLNKGKQSNILQDVETPRCSSGNSSPAECSTPSSLNSPPPLEELHRNITSSLVTPAGLSSVSIHTSDHEQVSEHENDAPIVADEDTPRRTNNGRRNFNTESQPKSADNAFGLPYGPAAGLGPQEVIAPESNQAIFSVRGTRSFKINRHRDCVSVFPSGCMGVKDDIVGETPVADVPAMETPVVEAPVVVPVSSPSLSYSPNAIRARPNSGARNPLTGEGYCDKDYKRQTLLKQRAEDGNPVLGQGYDPKKNSRGTKVPPGGYSTGLW